MKKRCVLLTVIFVLLFTVSAHAMEARYATKTASLRINAGIATCKVYISEGASDEIDATIRLYKDNTCIKTWRENGVGYINLDDTKAVSSGYYYELIVEYTINNVEQPDLYASQRY